MRGRRHCCACARHKPHGGVQCLAIETVTHAALADGEGTCVEVLDVDGEAVPRADREKPAPCAAEFTSSRRGVADAEQEEVDAVLGIVGELAHLIHPLPDEVVHGALVGLGVLPEEGVHDGHLVPQMADLAADATEEAELLAHQLPKLPYKGLSYALRVAQALVGKLRPPRSSPPCSPFSGAKEAIGNACGQILGYLYAHRIINYGDCHT